MLTPHLKLQKCVYYREILCIIGKRLQGLVGEVWQGCFGHMLLMVLLSWWLA